MVNRSKSHVSQKQKGILNFEKCAGTSHVVPDPRKHHNINEVM